MPLSVSIGAIHKHTIENRISGNIERVNLSDINRKANLYLLDWFYIK